MNGRCDTVDYLEFYNSPCYYGICEYCDYSNICTLALQGYKLDNIVIYSEGE